MKIYGVDFTSTPDHRKPITVAHAVPEGRAVRILRIERLPTLADFEALLGRPGPWIGGFDFPFGLPRELVRDLGWPSRWLPLVDLCANLSRRELRGILDGYRATRPAGRKYAHRSTDAPAGSSSPMKLVNPPVALMFHEGATRLAESGVHVPGLREGDRTRVALEAYPGMFARGALGRVSYKSDERARQTAARRDARRRLVAALPARLDPALRRELTEDATGDALDAAICAIQAAWGWRRRARRYGLPGNIEPCEGWIVGA